MGIVWVWGGQAGASTVPYQGDNSTTVKSSPAAICMGGRAFCDVSLGFNHVIGLDPSGQAWFWGTS
jgi:alpha-tubulin suppressor-like RCC1 family protein